MRNFLSMNLNLKMIVERSKCRSYFLSFVFITKYYTISSVLITGLTVHNAMELAKES